MAEPNTNPVTQESTPDTGGAVTFTQAEVDALVSKEKARAVAKATKGMPSEEELNAFRTWKNSQQTEQERWNNLTRERDESRTALSAAQAELEQLKREKYVLSKGLTGDEAEFIAFKAAKMIDDTTTFEKAVDALTAERKKTTFDWTAPVGGGTQKVGESEVMNALIRGALK
jgi:molecular chaperone GrpE (heat shock protein)